VSRYQKGKTNLDFNKARDSEWQWHQLGHMQVCTVLQTDNHASTPPLSFLQARCSSCRPANSVRALKVYVIFDGNSLQLCVCVCVRLLAMTREAKMKELEMLDAARRKFMNFTQQQKEAELARLDDEIRQKVCQRRVLCSVF